MSRVPISPLLAQRRPTSLHEVRSMRGAAPSLAVFDLLGDVPRASLPRSGVRALMLAVFEDAVRCYFCRDRRIRAEAELWVDAGPRHWAFSFDVICESLGLDPAAVRAALRRMRANDPQPSMLRKRHRGTGRRAAVAVHA